MKKGNKKLQLDKIKITKLTNLHHIKGGDSVVVPKGDHSNYAGASGCICTVTMALSDDCNDTDYETDLCRAGVAGFM